MICLSKPYNFKFFKGCLPQIYLGPFLNTLFHLLILTENSHAVTNDTEVSQEYPHYQEFSFDDGETSWLLLPNSDSCTIKRIATACPSSCCCVMLIVEKQNKSYELRVQIHELRVQIHELRVQIHELRDQIHELRVQIHELED